MTRVLIDTNVLVSFLTDRDPEQQARAADLITAAAQREVQLLLHQQVLAELVYVLVNLYRRSREEIAAILRELLALPGALPVDELPWSLVLDLWPKQIPDFADAVLAATCKAGRHDSIATFDADFQRRLPGLGLEPYW